MLLSLLDQPWHHVKLNHFLVERVLEVANIFKEGEGIDLELAHELFAKDSTDDLFVGNLFGLTSTPLQCLLGSEGFEASRLCRLHLPDFSLFVFAHSCKALLLTAHLSKLLFLEDLHAGNF